MASNYHMDKHIPTESILKAFKNKKRLMIWNLFAIYNELNLAQLSDLMNMSKTAVHHHLKILRTENLIEPSRTEKSRGSIDIIYFRLTKGPHRFNVDEIAKIKDINRQLKTLKSMLPTLRAVMNDVEFKINLNQSFLTNFEKEIILGSKISIPSKAKMADWIQILQDHNVKQKYIYLDEEQYQKCMKLQENYYKEITKILDQNTKEKKNSHLLIHLDLPIENLLQFQRQMEKS